MRRDKTSEKKSRHVKMHSPSKAAIFQQSLPSLPDARARHTALRQLLLRWRQSGKASLLGDFSVGASHHRVVTACPPPRGGVLLGFDVVKGGFAQLTDCRRGALLVGYVHLT